jgi:hypothetical protein
VEGLGDRSLHIFVRAADGRHPAVGCEPASESVPDRGTRLRDLAGLHKVAE